MTDISSSIVGGERIHPIHLARFILGGIIGIILWNMYGLFPNSIQTLFKDVLGY